MYPNLRLCAFTFDLSRLNSFSVAFSCPVIGPPLLYLELYAAAAPPTIGEATKSPIAAGTHTGASGGKSKETARSANPAR